MNLLHRAHPLINNLLPEDNHYIVTNPADKLNVIGAFYESINSPRYLNLNTEHKRLVDETANSIKLELAHKKELKLGLTNFSTINPANKPIWNTESDEKSPFCDADMIKQILKNNPNTRHLIE